MKQLTILFLAGFISIAARAQADTAMTPPDSLRDGSSFGKAVIIRAANETAGVHAEYQWIRDHFPDYDTRKQALISKKGVPYDVLTIRNPNGLVKTVYFDISGFYGKM